MNQSLLGILSKYGRLFYHMINIYICIMFGFHAYKFHVRAPSCFITLLSAFHLIWKVL